MPASSQDLPDADAALVAGQVLPSARVPLDRDRNHRCGHRVHRRRGPARLTMRRLGDRLGVEAMSLYRYVPGKEDLLDAVVQSLVADMEQDDEVLLSPRYGWQDFLQRRLAHEVRRVALEHPKASR